MHLHTRIPNGGRDRQENNEKITKKNEGLENKTRNCTSSQCRWPDFDTDSISGPLYQ